MTNNSHSPTFFIVDSQDFLSEKYYHHHPVLPKNFIVSLMYKPLNNTVLSLFSVISHQKVHSEFQNITSSPEPVFQSSLLLSHSATLVQSENYFDLWHSFSDSRTSRYAVNLIVMNGQLGMCMDGEYFPPVQNAKVWNGLQQSDSLELRFTPHLESVSSMVCVIVVLMAL